jgi:hypothetical protein
MVGNQASILLCFLILAAKTLKFPLTKTTPFLTIIPLDLAEDVCKIYDFISDRRTYTEIDWLFIRTQ